MSITVVVIILLAPFARREFRPKERREALLLLRGRLSPATMGAQAEPSSTRRRIIVDAPHAGTTFNVTLFPGTSDSSLKSAIANRVRLPLQYADGTETFYLTELGDESIVPACADGFPDGQRLVMHVHGPPMPPPSPPPSPAAMPPDAPPPATAPVVERIPGPGSPAFIQAVKQQQHVAAEAAPASAPASVDMAPLLELNEALSGKGKAVITMQRHMRGVLHRRRVLDGIRARCGTRCVDFTQTNIDALAKRLGVSRYLPWNLTSYERMEMEKDKKDDEISGMAKMSRLSTDLANERTLLAWIRTVLAMMRTTFATLGIIGVSATWENVHYVAVAMTVVLMLLSAVIGVFRYYRVARICALKNIPQSFGRNRVPMWPMAVVFVSSLATVTVAVLMQGFEKA